MAHLVFLRLARRCLLVPFLRVRCRDCQSSYSGQMHSCCACLRRSTKLCCFCAAWHWFRCNLQPGCSHGGHSTALRSIWCVKEQRWSASGAHSPGAAATACKPAAAHPVRLLRCHATALARHAKTERCSVKPRHCYQQARVSAARWRCGVCATQVRQLARQQARRNAASQRPTTVVLLSLQVD